MTGPDSGSPGYAALPGGFRLEVIDGTGKGTVFDAQPGATVSIGRARENTLVLRDPVVSRRHAVIEPMSGGYRVRDAGSLAGVVRRGRRIPDEGALLADGDELELGPIILRFKLRKTPEISAPPGREYGALTRPNPTAENREAPRSIPVSKPAPPPPPSPPRASPEPPRRPPSPNAPPVRAPSAATAAPIGTFGRYNVLRSLGTSEKGALDLAVDPKTAAEVEIHRIPLSGLGWLARRRAFREYGRVIDVDHPNLSAATDAGREGDVAYRVYPHWPGARVEDILRDCRRHLTIPLATFIGREVSQGLAHVEKTLGKSHRAEVSGSTIVVSKSGSVVLQRAEMPLTPADRSRAKEGRYFAPEESGTRAGDHRSAIFALGVVLYELLARESIDASQKLSLRSIDTIRIDVPPILAEIVMRALEIRPTDRFESASAMEHALSAELLGMTPTMDETGLQRWMAERFP